MDVFLLVRTRGPSLIFLALAIHVTSFSGTRAEIRELPVPAATIYRGDLIGAAAITQRRFKVTPTSTVGFATEKTELIGMQARRRLIAGRPVPLNALKRPYAVKQGGIVATHYEEAGFSIMSSMTALQDGSVGDVIEARNAATGKVVLAVVQPDGSLLVSGQ